jgi:NTP pyrophosphatase (non-canonical NTP hydrolase)
MTEKQAIKIADKYVDNISTEDKIKWLSTEIVEVAMAFQSGDNNHLLEELGDCAFLISHIISRYENSGIINQISKAANKMKLRYEKKH